MLATVNFLRDRRANKRERVRIRRKAICSPYASFDLTLPPSPSLAQIKNAIYLLFVITDFRLFRINKNEQANVMLHFCYVKCPSYVHAKFTYRFVLFLFICVVVLLRFFVVFCKARRYDKRFVAVRSFIHSFTRSFT